MKEYCISGIVNVSMYQSVLDPDIIFDGETWNRTHEMLFDNVKYTAVVLGRAVAELKKMLSKLPEERRVEYVEGSAEIRANYAQNILDRLYFKVSYAEDIPEKTLQEYLTDFFLPDWDDEFGADYRIYEYIKENYTIDSFLREKRAAMKQVQDIYKQYNEVFFRTALYHLFSNGTDHFDGESVTACKEQIREEDRRVQDAKVIPIITAGYKEALWDCAAELSQCSLTDILAFVQRNLFFEQTYEDPKRRLLDTLMKHFKSDMIEYRDVFYTPCFHSAQQALNFFYPDMLRDNEKSPGTWTDEELALACK